MVIAGFQSLEVILVGGPVFAVNPGVRDSKSTAFIQRISGNFQGNVFGWLHLGKGCILATF